MIVELPVDVSLVSFCCTFVKEFYCSFFRVVAVVAPEMHFAGSTGNYELSMNTRGSMYGGKDFLLSIELIQCSLFLVLT